MALLIPLTFIGASFGPNQLELLPELLLPSQGCLLAALSLPPDLLSFKKARQVQIPTDTNLQPLLPSLIPFRFASFRLNYPHVLFPHPLTH